MTLKVSDITELPINRKSMSISSRILRKLFFPCFIKIYCPLLRERFKRTLKVQYRSRTKHIDLGQDLGDVGLLRCAYFVELGVCGKSTSLVETGIGVVFEEEEEALDFGHR